MSFVCCGLTSLLNMRSYCDGVCLSQWYFDLCAATQECHAADIDVERPTGIHNYPF